MIEWFRRQQAERRRIREAERRAVAAFEATGRGTVAWTGIVSSNAQETVIRVCFGHTRPPTRNWFAVSSQPDAPVRELSWDEVVPMGEKPWR
jgi:hypothetical protein